MAFGVLSKGDIVYYISYLGQKPERNDFTGNDGGRGRRISEYIPVIVHFLGWTCEKLDTVTSNIHLFSKLCFAFSASAPMKEYVSAVSPSSSPLTQGSAALALPKPSNRRFAVQPSLSCSKAFFPRSSQHFEDRISPLARGPRAVGKQSVSEFAG